MEISWLKFPDFGMFPPPAAALVVLTGANAAFRTALTSGTKPGEQEWNRATVRAR